MARQGDAEIDEAVAQIAKSLQQLTGSTQQIANCLGFLTIRFSEYRKKPNSESMPFLNGLGFDRHAIAAILGTTPAVVSTRLSEFRASKKRKESASDEDG